LTVYNSLYETAAYAVGLYTKTDAILPEEQRLSYGVFHKQHGVLFATTQSYGHAVTACQDLQTYIDEVNARENQPAVGAGKVVN
jgi:hypothetical protein